MTWYTGLVVASAAISVIVLAFYCRRYVRDVVDFLSAGRVAGRYVISVGTMEEMLGIMVLVQLMESHYRTGYGLSFWYALLAPVAVIIDLTGYCMYRLRETKAMTMGQFLEMRYGRALRIFSIVLYTTADILTEILGPALAARFFIYFFDLPFYFTVFGFQCSTFAALMLLTLSLAMIILWVGGSVSLLVTDCVQGLLSYPIFAVIVIFIICTFSWNHEIIPVMFDRAPGESFLNPFDISKLRDFNLFMIAVIIFTRIMNRAVWMGGSNTTSAKSAHEQRMANVLGTWRTGFSTLMCVLLGIAIITMMNHSNFSTRAHDTRQQLSTKIAEEVVQDAPLRRELVTQLGAIGEQKHQIGIDPPLSQKQNLDTPYIDTAGEVLSKSDNGKQLFQEFRTLYRQLMFPMAIRNLFPGWLLCIFSLMMLLMMVSTDDSRIFKIASMMAQDLVLPFRKKPMELKSQLLMIRMFSLLVGVIFFIGSFFMSQLDYIQMFTIIVGSVWTGGAGAVIVFGLYSRFGTTAGAFAALGTSLVSSIAGVTLQRNWAAHIYPFLERNGHIGTVGDLLHTVSSPFHPYVVWEVDPTKFPMNSYELLLLTMLTSISLYVIVSLLTKRKPFNLEKMLHRGEWSNSEHSLKEVDFKWSLRHVFSKLIGISHEHTKGDRIIAWSVFFYTFVYRFLLVFSLVILWNIFSPWKQKEWGIYYYITTLLVPVIIALISTVWFSIGGILDLRHLFADLAKRKRDASDDGRVAHEES